MLGGQKEISHVEHLMWAQHRLLPVTDNQPIVQVGKTEAQKEASYPKSNTKSATEPGQTNHTSNFCPLLCTQHSIDREATKTPDITSLTYIVFLIA